MSDLFLAVYRHAHMPLLAYSEANALPRCLFDVDVIILQAILTDLHTYPERIAYYRSFHKRGIIRR
jgi:hypothetical protein